MRTGLSNIRTALRRGLDFSNLSKIRLLGAPSFVNNIDAIHVKSGERVTDRLFSTICGHIRVRRVTNADQRA